MRTERQQIRVEGPEVDVDVTGGLRRVDVHQYAALATRRDHLAHGLHRAHFVIGPLDVDARGVGTKRVDHLVDVDATEAVHPDQRHRAGRFGREPHR